MADLALKWAGGTADLELGRGDLALDPGLETAVLISLFTDARAESGDVLPALDGDRRGWWGDAVPAVAGDEIGSRLWLLAREKQGEAPLRRAEEYSREALQWLVEDRVADRIDVEATAPGAGAGAGALVLVVTIHRPQQAPVEYRFNATWDAQGTKG